MVACRSPGLMAVHQDVHVQISPPLKYTHTRIQKIHIQTQVNSVRIVTQAARPFASANCDLPWQDFCAAARATGGAKSQESCPSSSCSNPWLCSIWAY